MTINPPGWLVQRVRRVWRLELKACSAGFVGLITPAGGSRTSFRRILHHDGFCVEPIFLARRELLG